MESFTQAKAPANTWIEWFRTRLGLAVQSSLNPVPPTGGSVPPTGNTATLGLLGKIGKGFGSAASMFSYITMAITAVTALVAVYNMVFTSMEEDFKRLQAAAEKAKVKKVETREEVRSLKSLKKNMNN